MSHSPNGALEYNRSCDVCWRRLTTLDDMCETCEDHLNSKIQEDNQEDNKEKNMNDNPQLTAQIEALEARIDNDAAHMTALAAQVTQLRQAEEDYRHDVRANIGRIEEVLHSHARDCDDQELIDGLIDQINQATRNGFPELRNCTRTYELTITYVVEVQAISEEDARDNFIDGEYDHLIELSDYYELDVDWGVV